MVEDDYINWIPYPTDNKIGARRNAIQFVVGCSIEQALVADRLNELVTFDLFPDGLSSWY